MDAMVAEKVLGQKVCRDQCPGGCDSPGGWMYHDGTWEGTKPYSTDLTTCAAAAEEARKAGKIGGWNLRSGGLGNDGDFAAGVWGVPEQIPFGIAGESTAHALALALLKAVGA